MTRATRTLTLVLTIAAASAILSYRPVYEPDLGWHLAHGREHLAGRLVRTNLFSFTWPEYPQRYTSWLSDDDRVRGVERGRRCRGPHAAGRGCLP